MKKFLVSLILLMLVCLPVNAEEIISGSDYKVNPLYEYLNIEDAQLYNASIDDVSYHECGDYDGALEYLLQQAKERNGKISLCYTSDISPSLSFSEINSLAKEECINLFTSLGDYSEFDKNASFSDYLFYQCGSRNISWYVIHDAKNVSICATFTISWFTTPEQVAEEDVKVKEILDELNVYEEDEYTQIKAVYDYVMDNAVYVEDSKYEEAEENKTNTIYHSSYSALIMGETVCQGYATAIYRLLRELGISCRVVSGDAAGGRHAWNMVRIGSYYYLIDATWDDGLFRLYRYFLKANYTDHMPDSDFTETSFKRFFPMAEEDYSEPLEYIPNAPANITITCEGEGAIITFDLDYTAQYAYVERNNELVYLEENPLEDKTTHRFKDTPPRGDVTYEISALRAEYNSRTEEERHHFNTVSSVFHKVLSIELEEIEGSTLKAVLYHNDANKKGKLLVMVSRSEEPEEIFTYSPQDEIIFTYENFTSDCKIKFMWIDLTTMKPLSENVEF